MELSFGPYMARIPAVPTMLSKRNSKPFEKETSLSLLMQLNQSAKVLLSKGIAQRPDGQWVPPISHITSGLCWRGLQPGVTG